MTTLNSLNSLTTANHAVLPSLIALFACPSCGDGTADLAVRIDAFVCNRCKTRYPVYKSGRASVPWLFRDPEAVRLEWRARFNGFLQANATECSRLNDALSHSRSETASQRMRQVLHAREMQRKHVMELLGPLSLGAARAGPNLDRTGLLQRRLPKQLGLLSYDSNIVRDWSWDNAENDCLFECVRQVLSNRKNFTAGRILTIGAGACRLSYDVHRHYAAELSVAIDVHPLLLMLASRVIHGETVPFYEFPIAPLNKASFAILRECAAPEPIELGADSGFFFVLGDGLNAPFKPGSFDTVLTPWLIDIVPDELSECVRAVNRLLGIGGIWINTGSLAFFHRNEAWRYSQEEVLDIVKANGFEILDVQRSAVPYLQSPASGYGRIERVLSFSARKLADAQAPATRPALPEWLLESGGSVPDLDEFAVASASHWLQAQVLAAVNGHRTIDQIAFLLAKQHGFQRSEAAAAVRRILLDLYETSVTLRVNPHSALE